MAQVVQQAPIKIDRKSTASQNPLIMYYNKFIPFQYHNSSVKPSDLTRSQPSSSYSEQNCQEKLELMLIIITEKEWSRFHPREIAQRALPPQYHYIPHERAKTIKF